MRKFIALAAICSVILLAAYFTACKNEDKKTETTTTGEDSVKKVLARGEYLAHYVSQCMDCHSIRDTSKFAMPVLPGTEGGGAGFPFGKGEGVPGMVTPPNITPFALKDWTDDEIIRAITQGVNKKGDTLFPIMPYHSFSRMTKSDIHAIVAYIRTLKPIDRTVMPRKLDVPMSMMGPLPVVNLENNVMPDTSDKVKYGQYVITAALCGECHTPMGPQGHDFSKAFAGGFVFDLPMFKVVTANITPDSTTGIGAISEETFVQKFRTNASADMINRSMGRENTVMPWAAYGKMTDTDLRAIYAYLRTVKPISNLVVKHPK